MITFPWIGQLLVKVENSKAKLFGTIFIAIPFLTIKLKASQWALLVEHEGVNDAQYCFSLRSLTEVSFEMDSSLCSQNFLFSSTHKNTP